MHRKFSVFGDSISTFEGCVPDGFNVFYCGERLEATGVMEPAQTWWSQVVGHFGGTVLANASWSGSMVEGAGYPAAWSPERLDAIGSDGQTPDDILIFIGINDYGWGGALQQAMGRSMAMPPSTDVSAIPAGVAGLAPQGALDGFACAYRAMLQGMKTQYQTARIWCISLLPGRLKGVGHSTHAWNLRGIPMDEYNATIESLAGEMGCSYVDAVGYGYDYEALDGTHPTALGMRQIAALVIAAMEGKTNPEQGLFDTIEDSWASERFCREGPCVGCEWAKGTGNSWYCVCEKPR